MRKLKQFNVVIVVTLAVLVVLVWWHDIYANCMYFIQSSSPQTVLSSSYSSLEEEEEHHGDSWSTTGVGRKQRRRRRRQNNFIYHDSSTKKDFVSGLTTCILDSNCHILYQHVQKTGGQGVQSLFFSFFPEEGGHKACCREEMLEKFRLRPAKYCNRQFSGFEVHEGFEEIVQTCQKLAVTEDHYQGQKDFKSSTSSTTTNQQQQQKQKRFVVLTSIREPIQRTLSQIHQKCNKQYRYRDNRTKAACQKCTFTGDNDDDNDTDNNNSFWMEFVQETNDDYFAIFRREPSQYSQLLLSSSSSSSLPHGDQHQEEQNDDNKNIDHYWVDTMDLNRMIQDLQVALYPMYKTQFDSFFNMSHNAESLKRCEFSMHSKMIKGLRSSIELYRNFTLGRLR